MDRRLKMHEAKTHLSRELARLKPGDRLIICKRDQPVAEVRSLLRPAGKKRRLGLARGEFTVPAAFFEPLPAELLDAWEAK